MKANRLAFFALFLVCLFGCQDAKAPTTPQIGQTADLVVCILTSVVPDVVAHKPWATCVSDAVTACGVDAATVVAVWGAHVNAEAREGFTPIALISQVPQSK